MSKKRSGFSMWLLIWGLGLAGQICWNVENQWFNTFVYAKIGKDPSIITGMLICSAAATTFSTFFFGTWSDRTGKRRHFIAAGYILWGVFTIAFGLTEFISKEVYTLVAVSVVLADTVMSFFGSMGNDAGFNTWTNDIMTDRNRGGSARRWPPSRCSAPSSAPWLAACWWAKTTTTCGCSSSMGVFVIVFGLISMFTLNKSDDAPPREGSFWQQFFSVFNFKQFFQHKELVWVNVGVAVFFIGFNVYFAYIGNYLIHYLGYTAAQMGIIEAVPLVFAMLSAIPIGMLINRDKHPYVAIAAVICNIIGLLIIYPVKAEQIDPSQLFNWRIWLGILVMGIGYIGILQVTKVWAKQLYPENAKGQFEGIWTIFFVLIPMVGGSLIGEAVVKTGGETFTNLTSGQTEYIPNGNIFLVGAVVVFFTLIPLLLSIKYHRQRQAAKNSAR